MREPWCQFCRIWDKKKQKFVFDYDEFHAIECGIGDGLLIVAPMRYAWIKHADDWHYYMLARGLATFVALSLLIALARLVLEAHYVL